MKEKYHFIGLGGIGMSALAHILLDKKLAVSGSDLSENGNVKSLCQKGATFFHGQKKENITEQKTVVFSTDIREENPEILRAKELKCRLLHRSDLLKELMEDCVNLAVAGTHGKTSVTAILVSILKKAGLDPSFAIGGLYEGENGKAGKGKYFVAEADESDGSFLKYKPFGAIVTNVEKEHMNHYGSEKELQRAFQDFLGSVVSSEHLFYCGDDLNLTHLAQGRGYSYGFQEGCDLNITSFSQKGWRIIFDITFEGKTYQKIEASLMGEMHALNAAAAFGLSLKLGIQEEHIRDALSSYTGVKRRLEKKGEIDNCLFIDDYAHHPTEVKKTLSALREAVYEKRLIVLFQPHRYSRLQDLMEEFAQSFECADHVFVLEVYSAGEKPIEGISSQKLVEKIREKGSVPAEFLSRHDYLEYFSKFLRPHDVIVTMGAGDVTAFLPPLIDRIAKNPLQKYKLGLIFGGRSCEHEISLRSARFVYDSLDKNSYEISVFGIDKKGFWIEGEKALTILQKEKEVKTSEAKPLLSKEISEALAACDIFFPVLHGPNGEDGTIQGFFEMLGKPYAGCDFKGCAITMDKVLTKKLLHEEGVPTSPFTYFHYHEWLKDKLKVLKKVKEKLNFPVFVKPTSLGSSIGVSKVEKEGDLEKAIVAVFKTSSSVIVEEGFLNARELEFAVIGNDEGHIDVPPPGEKCAQGHYVDYEMKYGKNAVKTTVDPFLEKKILEKGKRLAEKAYRAIGITGISRVDCLLNAEGEFSFFEINAIPGLTSLSLFPKIWGREGVTPLNLMNRIIFLGLKRRREQNRHEYVLP